MMKRKLDSEDSPSEDSPTGVVHIIRNTRPRMHEQTPSSSASHSYIATPARIGRIPIHSSPSVGPGTGLLVRGSELPILAKRSLSLSSVGTESSSSSETIAEGDDPSTSGHSDSESESDSNSGGSTSDSLSATASAGSLDAESEETSESSSDQSDISSSDESDASSEPVLTYTHRQSRTTRINPLPVDSLNDDSSDDRMVDDMLAGTTGQRTTIIEGVDGTTILRMGTRPVISHESSSSVLLSRLRTFLPEMENANRALEDERARGAIGDRIMEAGDDEGGECIEMNLGLGVLEPRSNEVVITDDGQEMEDETHDDDVMERLLGGTTTTTQAFVQEV